jgi:hypothetical protein
LVSADEVGHIPGRQVEMTGYAMEILAKQRTEERLREADRDRLARAVATRPLRGRSWHARLWLAVAHGRIHVAEAS